MTKDEVLNIPAGREMDALVAEKVMRRTATPWDYGDRRKHPYFSTDISAAWQVVEKMMRETVGCLYFDLYGDTMISSRHPTEFTCRIRMNGEHVGRAKTAPLAICRASLLCVME